MPLKFWEVPIVGEINEKLGGSFREFSLRKTKIDRKTFMVGRRKKCLGIQGDGEGEGGGTGRGGVPARGIRGEGYWRALRNFFARE